MAPRSKTALAKLPPGWRSVGPDQFRYEAHTRVWTVYRKEPGKGWWYAAVNGTPVRDPMAVGPKYWAFLSKALKQVERLARNKAALAFMVAALPNSEGGGGDLGGNQTGM